MSDDREEYVRMIRDSAAAIAPRDGGLDRIRALRFSAPGWNPAVLREIGELGWIALRLEEGQGGVGLGMAESVALYEELGRGLVPEPLVAQTLAASLLAQTDEQALLEGVIAGEAVVAVAWGGSPDAIGAAQGGQAVRRFVVGADQAQHVLVPDGEGTIRLLAVADASVEPIALQDGGFAYDLTIPSEAGRTVAEGKAPAIAKALDEAALGTAAYLLGLAEAAFEMTIGYLGQRRQFNQLLSGFQALQHRCADMKIQLTLTRASIGSAVAECDAGAAPHARSAAVSRAKARAADTAMLVAREAIQMHGAIGYTDEYDVGLHARKALVLANAYGSAAAHRHRYMALAADLPA